MGTAANQNILLLNILRSFKTIAVLILLAVAIGIGAAGPFASAQKRVDAAPGVKHFELGEELHFEAEFSRALLRKLDVADLTFRAVRTPLEEANSSESKPYALTFSADVASKGFFARLFNLKFRERVESTVEPASFTVQKTTILDEQGKRVRTTEATFDQSKGKMTWTLRDPNNPSAEPRRLITDFSGQLQDVLVRDLLHSHAAARSWNKVRGVYRRWRARLHDPREGRREEANEDDSGSRRRAGC